MVKHQTGLEVVGPFFYDKTDFSFALATFYYRRLFHVKNTGIIPLPGDKICLWVLFESLESGKQIIIANTHFVVSPEEVKMESIEKLFPELESLGLLYKCPLVVNGDFNLFDDLDGLAHRAHIIKKFQVSNILYYPLNMNKDSTERRLSGTFIGYPEVDAFHKTPDTMSRLDHGFMFSDFPLALVGDNAYTVGVTENNLKTAELSSDHLPCVREFML